MDIKKEWRKKISTIKEKGRSKYDNEQKRKRTYTNKMKPNNITGHNRITKRL